METAKKRVETAKCEDNFLLLSYKSAPLENRYGLAELLMERRVKITVSVTIEQLLPTLPYHKGLQGTERR